MNQGSSAFASCKCVRKTEATSSLTSGVLRIVLELDNIEPAVVGFEQVGWSVFAHLANIGGAPCGALEMK